MTGIAVRGFIVSGFTGAGDTASPPAALSTAGTSSTPQPNGPLADPGRVAVPASGQSHKRRRWWPRGFVPNVLIALAAFGFLTGSCLDTCTRMNTIRHVPAIHGRVVDMGTGQPIAGVKVTRWFERGMIAGPGGSDTYRVKGSLRTVTSDTAGRFEFPAWYGIARGINAVQWAEYKPGWVAGWGHLVVSNPPRLAVAKRHPPKGSVEAETDREGSTATIVLTLHRVDTPTAAEDHFWAMSKLAGDGIVPLTDFVKDASDYVAAHAVTEGMLLSLADLTDRINPYVEPALVDERCAILGGIAKYCISSAGSRWCRSATVSLCIRDYKDDCGARENWR